jgi:hypothetical protein
MPAGRCSSDQPSVNAGPAVRIGCPAERGPAPNRGFRIFLLRSSRVRRAFPTPSSDLDAAVLQPFLPSGFASRDRARTAMAPAGTLPSVPAGRASFPRTVSSSGNSFPPAAAAAKPSIAPRRRRGAGEPPRPLGAPRFLSPILLHWSQGDGSIPGRSSVPCAT